MSSLSSLNFVRHKPIKATTKHFLCFFAVESGFLTVESEFFDLFLLINRAPQN